MIHRTKEKTRSNRRKEGVSKEAEQAGLGLWVCFWRVPRTTVSSPDVKVDLNAVRRHADRRHRAEREDKRSKLFTSLQSWGQRRRRRGMTAPRCVRRPTACGQAALSQPGAALPGSNSGRRTPHHHPRTRLTQSKPHRSKTGSHDIQCCCINTSSFILVPVLLISADGSVGPCSSPSPSVTGCQSFVSPACSD